MVALTVKGSEELGRFSIIDDSNYKVLADDRNTRDMRGLQPRDYGRHPFGSMPFGTFPFPVIPRSEWRDRIEEGHAKKTFAIYHSLRMKVPRLNQKRLPYCWMYGTVGAIQTARAMHGLKTVHLSATSAAGPGKRYREEGGWAGEAIGYINEYGIATVNEWPEAVNDPRYFNPSREVAKNYGIGQWFELRAKKFDQLMTCLLMGFPVTVGLLWMGHLMYVEAPTYPFGGIVTNSWGQEWENDGRIVFLEEKLIADEQYCITTPKFDEMDEYEQKRYQDFYDTLTAS